MTVLNLTIAAGLLLAISAAILAAKRAEPKRVPVPARTKKYYRVPLVLLVCAVVLPAAGAALGLLPS
jgi:hypothetical protein